LTKFKPHELKGTLLQVVSDKKLPWSKM